MVLLIIKIIIILKMLAVQPVISKPPRRTCKKVVIKDRRVKQMFRMAKSEIAAELLSKLWDSDDYNLETEIYPLWIRKIIPLIKYGLDVDRAYGDMYRFIDSL